MKAVKVLEGSVDVVSFNIVIHACARLSKNIEADRLLRRLQVVATPTQVSYNTVISAHCQAARSESKRARSRFECLHLRILHGLLNGLCRIWK